MMLSTSVLAAIVGASLLFAWGAALISLVGVADSSREAWRDWCREVGALLYFSAIAIGGVYLRSLV